MAGVVSSLGALALLALAAAPAPVPPQIQRNARGAEAMLLLGQAVAYVPPVVVARLARGDRAAPPLLVLLHGAGRQPGELVAIFAAEADRRGIVLLAPSAAAGTWDAVTAAEQPPSPDGSRLDQRLAYGHSRDGDRVEASIAALAGTVPVDRTRTVLAGFSDGATFALALGMAADHRFAAVLSFSPGIPIRAFRPASGRPVFVAHGRQDSILAFATTCSAILPMLRKEGARVSFRAFDGDHVLSRHAITEFLDAAFGPAPGDIVHRAGLADEQCPRGNAPPAEVPPLPKGR